MILYDTDPQVINVTGIAQFEGDTHDLSQKEITKSFKKAKKMALARLRAEMKELQEQIDIVNCMTKESCPTIDNPYS